MMPCPARFEFHLNLALDPWRRRRTTTTLPADSLVVAEAGAEAEEAVAAD
jgi:hypothetical protein